MEFYPLYFKPIYQEKIWGGHKLNTFFNRQLPSNNIGESWEVAAHPHGTSIINNGLFKNKKLPDLINKYPKEMLGTNVKEKYIHKFPLLIKFLDANKKLSVQVHPDNQYAQKVEGELGKTEMWYILAANPGAKLIYGLKEGCTKKTLEQAIATGKIEDYLNEVPVKKGDVFFIDAGTIHAIEEGILLAEIQQNSDTTYRFYDWQRVDENGKMRPLHIDKALDVTNYHSNTTEKQNKILTINKDNYQQCFLAACPYFITELIKIKKDYLIKPAKERFHILIPISGQGKLSFQDKNINLKAGKTIFLPAALQQVNIEGNVELLNCYLPSNKSSFIRKLKKLGFSQEEINTLPGINNWQ